VRTGPEWSERHTLTDGSAISLRHVRPGDAAEVKRGFDRLSPESRHRRFFGGFTRLSDAALRYLTEVDGGDHVAIVAVRDSPDLKSEVGVGVARFIRLTDEPNVAEAAVTVVDEAQRKGVGRLLAVAMAEAARERGVDTFRADVLADNAPMMAIMREVHAVERGSADGVVTYDVPLGPVAARGGAIDRILREAASSMAVLLRRIVLPPGYQ
jgi:GNAT superfamily N-acetyltransferase